jgi:molybdate transport system substrate-binding protein
VRRVLLVLAAVALASPGCGDDEGEANSGDRPQLVVSAAASMSEALEACSPAFEDAAVRLQFAGSDELAAQIRQGAKPDVYASANTGLPEELHREGILSRPVEFATNELVIAVPKDSEIDALDDLTRAGVKVVMGSESVPIGAYTRETLAKLPRGEEDAILAGVRSNEPDVKGIVGKLMQGAADAGFVYVTDVNATDGALEALELPADLQPTVTYAAGVVNGTEQPAEARTFARALVDGPCADALEEAGFGRAPP